MNYCAVEDGLVVEGGRGSLKAGKKKNTHTKILARCSVEVSGGSESKCEK